MESLILFSIIIAGIMGVLSTISTFLRVYWSVTYTDLQRSIDRVVLGGEYVYRPMRPLLVAIVCWSWFFAFYGRV